MKAILLALAILGGATDRPAVPQTYRLDLAVAELDLTAERSRQAPRWLAEPVVVTQSGRPAYFRAGTKVAALLEEPTGVTGPGVAQPRFGLEVRVTPIRLPSGQLRVEVTGEWV